jgi:hypothetical protein
MNGHETLSSSTVSGNYAGDSGGGIYNYLAYLTLQGSTVTQNTNIQGADNIDGGYIFISKTSKK